MSRTSLSASLRFFLVVSCGRLDSSSKLSLRLAPLSCDAAMRAMGACSVISRSI
ncbi:MAG: hypothetical protein ACJAYU_004864 [Bradymonadia bacterium]|jgi:hypothetical protein